MAEKEGDRSGGYLEGMVSDALFLALPPKHRPPGLLPSRML